MRKVAIEIPGEETDKLAAKARKYNSYIFGASYELDADWPDRYFNCGFIIDPAGEIALKYRKIQCGVIETGCSPHEVLDEYFERYGYDSLFPVLDTPIGKLGLLICADGLFGPKVARALAMKGAEILCFPISTTSPESTVQTLFHLDALRHYRLRTPYGVASIRSETYAPLYQRSYVPPNFFLEEPEQSLADERRLRDLTFQRMFEAGIYVPPPENVPTEKKPAPAPLEKIEAE